jgi:NAD(P)H-dependent flavin oxidoreductase YrpB (nitropropane dioxygenase family)
VLVVSDRTFDQRRIHRKDDWIKNEVERALERSRNNRLQIVLISTDKDVLPNRNDLPEDIQAILDHHALPISLHTFDEDINKIVDFISTISPIKRLQQ